MGLTANVAWQTSLQRLLVHVEIVPQPVEYNKRVCIGAPVLSQRLFNAMLPSLVHIMYNKDSSMRHALLVIFCLLQVFAHSALSLEYWASSSAEQQSLLFEE